MCIHTFKSYLLCLMPGRKWCLISGHNFDSFAACVLCTTCGVTVLLTCRLPCDERCYKQLTCGHQCPGVCGEACPDASYCAHPDCRSTAPSNVLDQVGSASSLVCCFHVSFYIHCVLYISTCFV
jgi:hypothetical protein